MRPVAFSLAILLLAACAPATEWVRANTDTATRNTDQADCDAIAAWQALDESAAAGPKYPPYRDTQFVVDGGNDGGGITTSYSRRGPRQYELAEYCMTQRGYRLVPQMPERR